MRLMKCAALPVSIGMLLMLPTASAAKPSVTLAIPEADAGAPISYSYTSSRVPRRAKLVIQRRVGTARRYKTVVTLAPAASGSGALPALDVGRYEVRIAIMLRRWIRRRLHTVVLAQQRASLAVFGTVTFSTLFRQTERTYSTPIRSFSYIFFNGYVADFQTATTVDSADNTCRSVHIDWVARSTAGNDATTAEVALIQESRDPVTSTAAPNVISAADAFVTPRRSWGLNVSTVGPGTHDFFINGTASCYSRSLVG